MSKITVKHYLNVNLKPYIVRGEKYYNIYLLVVAKTKNTKIKSHEFSELYTEMEFNEFLIKENEGFEKMQDEVITITNIVNTMFRALKLESFDTLLFSALYNIMPQYKLDHNDSFELITTFEMWNFTYLEGGEHFTIPTFYDFFTPKFQKLLANYLIEQKANVSVEKMNDFVLMSFFEILQNIVRVLSKYNELSIRYDRYLGTHADSLRDILEYHFPEMTMPKT